MVQLWCLYSRPNSTCNADGLLPIADVLQVCVFQIMARSPLWRDLTKVILILHSRSWEWHVPAGNQTWASEVGVKLSSKELLEHLHMSPRQPIEKERKIVECTVKCSRPVQLVWFILGICYPYLGSFKISQNSFSVILENSSRFKYNVNVSYLSMYLCKS